MVFDSFRDFVNAFDCAGERKRISQPGATKLKITGADQEMAWRPGSSAPIISAKMTC